jgi:large conductance mechanosensitive channel
MGMLQEFKAFALKGNVMDLAVGVMIGAAFGKIVDSLVGDMLMPLIGALVGKLDFSNLFVLLGTPPPGTALTLDALKKAGVPVLAYGSFITVLVNFVLLAAVVFGLVQALNRFKQQEAPAPLLPTSTPEDTVLLREIRDALKK